jgi:hypothetical protein
MKLQRLFQVRRKFMYDAARDAFLVHREALNRMAANVCNMRKAKLYKSRDASDREREVLDDPWHPVAGANHS